MMFYKSICIVAIAFASFVYESGAHQVVDSMMSQIDHLRHHPEESFASVDLRFSQHEMRMIDQLKVETTEQYNRFGNLQQLKDELPQFLRSIGNDDIEVIQVISNLIARISDYTVKASGKETAWVAVRAFTPSSVFDIPRWHRDGHFFSAHSGFAYKFAATLKGNATLFYRLPPDLQEAFAAYEDDRTALAQLLSVEASETAPKGYGAFFIVGEPDTAAVHSEPKMDQSRLFFSVMVGSEAEIQELDLRWQN
ncbi:MAG: hypothetical protein LLG04_00900 [Parachlamydia sp.]|nr:hypothetical protein [Parachlamydia sp.]